MKRRKFLTNLAGLTAIGVTSDLISFAALAENRITPKNIIIRSGWSMDELGARLYLPAAFKMIQRNIPGAVIHFWPYRDDDVIMEKIKLNTTRFSLLTGDLEHKEDSGELLENLKKADMVFHFGGTIAPGGITGLASDLRSSKDLFDFCTANKIPYILHSLKIADENKIADDEKVMINNASAVYASYSADNKVLNSAGIDNKNFETDPDAVLYFDLNDDITAGKYLRKTDLAGKQFLILSLRRKNLLGQDLELEKHFPKYADMIKAWHSDTGNPVLVINGDNNDSEYIRKKLNETTAPDVKDHLILLDDTSDPSAIISVVDKARICIGNDPYVLMMAVSSKVPVCFTQTSDSDRTDEIFKNIGLEERVIGLNSVQENDLSTTLLSMNKNYVDELVGISKVVKILSQTEKKIFKSIDKTLGIKLIDPSRRRPSGGYQHHRGGPGGY